MIDPWLMNGILPLSVTQSAKFYLKYNRGRCLRSLNHAGEDKRRCMASDSKRHLQSESIDECLFDLKFHSKNSITFFSLHQEKHIFMNQSKNKILKVTKYVSSGNKDTQDIFSSWDYVYYYYYSQSVQRLKLENPVLTSTQSLERAAQRKEKLGQLKTSPVMKAL